MEPISHTYVLTAIVAYLAGSIPFGLILVKITGAGNLREIGYDVCIDHNINIHHCDKCHELFNLVEL